MSKEVRVERRKARRRPISSFVWVAPLQRNETATFRLFDISSGGARICIGPDIPLPKNFLMLFTADARVRRHCEVVWRDEAFAGVRFLPDNRHAPAKGIKSTAKLDEPGSVYID